MKFNLLDFLKRKSFNRQAHKAKLQLPIKKTQFLDIPNANNNITAVLQESRECIANQLLTAAKIGLFLTNWPPPDGQTINNIYISDNLESRPYQIRLATLNDITSLQILESHCWIKELRTSEKILFQRITKYPQGQLVLEANSEIIGVIYSQRITQISALDNISITEIDTLHNSQAQIVQLLAVNILPHLQQQNFGNQLLEFMLIYQGLQDNVQSIIAVTLCKNFNRVSTKMSMQDYIKQRNIYGVLADPILRFHELHGASIERVIPGYRPNDFKNNGAGVLVSYDIHYRNYTNLQISPKHNKNKITWTVNNLHEYVQSIIKNCLDKSRIDVFDDDCPLMEMGLDSTDLLEIKERILHHCGINLTPTFFFQYNNVNKITKNLIQKLKTTSDVTSIIQNNSSNFNQNINLITNTEQVVNLQEIAIIGIACRLPGDINTIEALWDCLKTGSSKISTLPQGRWSWPHDIDLKNKHKGINQGGFLKNIATFDAQFFRISTVEAESMDPQQRILLELSWTAIEHAGYAPSTLSGSNTGVFVGASNSDYSRLLIQYGAPIDAHYCTGSSMAILANRISYFYNFHGPSLVLDTACSSSLVALHKAIQSIQSGESIQALVGGINLICHPANNIAYYKAGMLSRDGLCKTFDEMANGYVRSEGAVVMLLKPLSIAQRDNDTIHAVIKGSASNHGGEASGLTVPNPLQQANLLKNAWHNARINPMHLSYIETHGTGTSLGDPLEVQGIKEAFATFLKKNQQVICGLGSVKTNLGHLEAAAGIVSLLKVVLCLQKRQLPINVNYTRLNAHIDLSHTNLYIVNKLTDWKSISGTTVRTAGVSSFGSGGTNVHVVVEEYIKNTKLLHQSISLKHPQLFVLSAKTYEQLQQYVKNCVHWLNNPSNQLISLENIIFQFQIGRQPMAKRLAIVVSTRKELINKLTKFIILKKSEKVIELTTNILKISKENIDKTFIRNLIEKQEWETLAQLWLSGAVFDWSMLYTKENFSKLQRFSVPTYPFAHKEYWVSHKDISTKTSPVHPKIASHNLLSKFKAQLFVPQWQLLNKYNSFHKSTLSQQDNQRVLIIGVDLLKQQHITTLYPLARLFTINAHITLKSIITILNEGEIFNHIIWIAPVNIQTIVSFKDCLNQQKIGVLFLFKLIKGLLNTGYNERKLDWTILTYGTQSVFKTDYVTAVHAGVHGLTGAMAKEYPQWKVRSIDLDFTHTISSLDLSHIQSLPEGEVIAYRGGQAFCRLLNPIIIPKIIFEIYKQGGIYVIIGGAGGIGQVWSRYVVKRYAAQVVWIGRRPQDIHIKAAQDNIAKFGPRPLYLSANAADAISLKASYTKIKQHYGNIHGVIQSATGIFDHSLAEMQEERFHEILSSKIDISVNLAKIFSVESLDFILYFSSIESLEKHGGHSGYAAGGAFEDAFALQLASQLSYAVKVINWGHWTIGTGTTISDAVKTRFLNSGGIPIEENEAMVALQQLLNVPLSQAALLKTSRLDLLPFIDTQHTLEILAVTIPSVIENIKKTIQTFDTDITTLKLTSIFNHPKMEAALLPLFASTVANINYTVTKINFYQHWLNSSRKILKENGFDLSKKTTLSTLEQLWKTWEIFKAHHLNIADIKPAVALVEMCLHALPQVIAGVVKATDLLFPNASIQLVEEIYRNNATAHYFNTILAQSVVSAINARLKHNSHTKLCILEIGAGSGSTTATILPLLEPYRNNILEYTYTDISKAFLFHAEENFVSKYTYVVPRLFNVEKPLKEQNLPIQHYDLVIATNVLHATRNIRHTLTNVKTMLHRHGLLLLNEISMKSLFAHLTFGLLEGWWLSEDQVLRIQDTPGLYPDSWKTVLIQTGFTEVLFPIPKAHILGQQIIIAESDGIIRQKTTSQINLDIQQKITSTNLLIPSVKSKKIIWHQTLKEATNNILRNIVARILRMDNTQIDVREPLEIYGIDSILVMQLTNALRETFSDININSTLMFECQTIEALSEYFIVHAMPTLLSLTGIVKEPDTLSYQNEKSMSRTKKENTAQKNTKINIHMLPENINESIAIIGMSCHFPQANNINEYWKLLSTGKNCIREIPSERWTLENFFHSNPDEAIKLGKSYSKWGAFLDNVTNFDPLFFNISPREAIAIDPQERLFLQTAWETLEDAGYTRQRLLKEFHQQLGVFVGITRTGFDLFGPELWRHGHIIYPHTSFSSIANRVSYFFDARGPSIPVDTMCSSSLTAVHLACQSLQNKECQIALVGGVNIYLHYSGYIGLSATRMLSKDGICRSFGKNSNGFVPGEGVGAVLLKPLSRAIVDNDQIHAVIRATHINHSGKTNGYTVPNPLAQAELIISALNKAKLNAREISYIEAHGTGTELGDPIEVTGLTKAFRNYTQDNNYCSLGSVKSNIGHLEAAAGIAGLIKVVLQMRHGKLVPSLHAKELNPNIDFDKTPFIVQQTLTDWPRQLSTETGIFLPRIAGVSSFGAGGVNAHIILAEYLQENNTQFDTNEDYIILLSARNKESLNAAVRRLYNFIIQCNDQRTPLVLADLAYTLQIGREHMDVRLALAVRTVTQLKDNLNAILIGNLEKIDVYTGDTKKYKDIIGEFSHDETMQKTIASWFSNKQYKHLLNLWSKGLDVNWKTLHSEFTIHNNKRKCISLPTYVFTPTPYWLPIIQESVNNNITKTIIPAAAKTTVTSTSIYAKPSSITLQIPIIKSSIIPTHTTTVLPQNVVRDSYTQVKPINTITIFNNSAITLYQENNNIFIIQFENLEYSSDISIDNICLALSDCFYELQKLLHKNQSHVVLLQDLNKMFPAQNTQHSFAITKMITAIVSCTVPVITVLRDDNHGYYTMLVAAACDLIIYSMEGMYNIASTNLSNQARQYFAARLGERATQIIEKNPIQGNELLNSGWLAPIVNLTEIDMYVNRTVEAILKISPLVLTEIKQHLNRKLIPLIVNLEDALKPLISKNDKIQTLQQLSNLNIDLMLPLDSHTDTNINDNLSITININSDVVSVKKYKNGVVLISLHDRINKNTFSSTFVQGLIAAFNHIANINDYKVVVLTGYDNYFACGGTKENLLAIQKGTAKFTDEQSYSMPLLCEIPVIAAMQGHAIGAGWTMGLFCDLAIYSEESIYQSPYMRYGFTPGAGSTLIFPERLGHDMSRNIFMTAREFYGREFNTKAINMRVMPRNQVLSHAMRVANYLALSNRQNLVQEKQRCTSSLRKRLNATFNDELSMHDKTFVGNPDVITGIERHYKANTKNLQQDLKKLNCTVSQTQVCEILQKILIEELQLHCESLNPDITFIEMGINSITAVTLIYKLNQQFHLTLETISIYNHPTLTKFSIYLLEHLNKIHKIEIQNPVNITINTDHNLNINKETLLLWLRDTLADELLIQKETLNDDMKFIDIGLDSITAVTWIRTINKHYGLSINATDVYSYPTLTEFNQYVWNMIHKSSEFTKCENKHIQKKAIVSTKKKLIKQFTISKNIQTPNPEKPISIQKSTINTDILKMKNIEAIAIIGMAGEFPKAHGIQEFWKNIIQGQDCVSEIPATRWNINDFYNSDRKVPGKTVCRKMGALDNISIFDPLFFNISPAEAEYMDPQQRLFLQNSWRCIEDAGYNPTDLSGDLVGIFVGCAVSDYGDCIKSKNKNDNVYALLGESISLLPARIAYFLNLQGPCLAIDTACSSSLVALASACDSLILGNSNLALAGGVYIINRPDIHIKMSKAGMLSPDGHCFSFDQRANGFVPGEGVGVLMLKRLQDAEKDHDDIYGIIRGWGVNQDGKTNGITAPNKESQIRLETGVYKKFGINPEYIELVEAHGTGTKLGDPIEVDALCTSFRQFTKKTNYCALGSAKSNIGHLATAAGVASIIKTILALKHKTLPPTIHYKTLNEHINLDESPFYINTNAMPWNTTIINQKRLAAINSFGFSGTNGHVVLEESILNENYDCTVCNNNIEILFPLSAKSVEQLIQYAQSLCDFLSTDTYTNSLSDLAYTFQIGRGEMRYRLAIIANTIEKLQEHLKNYVQEKTINEHCFYGDAVKYTAKSVIEENLNQEINLSQLAKTWVNGQYVNWNKLYKNINKPQRRHGLPTHPFAHEHYWIPTKNKKTQKKIQKNSNNTENLNIITTNTNKLLSWCNKKLPTDIPWKIKLKNLFSEKILVVYADNTQYQAFVNLLFQLKQAAYLLNDTNVEYHDIKKIKLEFYKNIPNTLLFLIDITTTQKINTVPWIQTLKKIVQIKKNNFLEIVILIQANTSTSNDLAHAISKIINSKKGRVLLISQENISLQHAIQILYREWIVFRESIQWLSQVHYTDNIRKIRVWEKKLSSCNLDDSIYLIRKEWIKKDSTPLIEFIIPRTVLILVNEDSLKIARELFNIKDFKRTIFIENNNKATINQLKTTITFFDATSANIAARSLIEQNNDITHIIDLGDLYEKNSQYEDDNLGKIIFYQHLVGTYSDIAIIYCTKNLQNFNSSQHTLKGAKFIGLMKMLSAEYLHVNSRCIDIDDSIYTNPQQLRKIILKEFKANLEETELCYRNNHRFVARLLPVSLSSYINAVKPVFLSDGIYVISGGTNGIGLEIANYLVSRGVRNIILMGITILPCKKDWIKTINEDNVSDYIKNKLIALVKLNKLLENLQIYTGNLSNLEKLQEYFKNVRIKYGNIKGVIHSAGIYSDIEKPGFVNKDLASIQAVLASKVTGLENLHAVFKNDILDFFVSFSSVTGMIPYLARGASDYAMANTFVDFFSSYHNIHHSYTRYKAIIWSDWNQTGAMTRIPTKKHEIIKENFRRLGIRTFLNNEGCILFEYAIALKEGGTTFIGYVDHEQFKNASPYLLHASLEKTYTKQIKRYPSSLYRHLEKWEATKKAGLNLPIQVITNIIKIHQIKNLEPSLISRIHKLLFNENKTAKDIQNTTYIDNNNDNLKSKNHIDLEHIITKIVMEVLKLKTIDPEKSFQNYGLDSISAMVLATRLEKYLGKQVLPQWFIDFSTIKTLTAHFVKQNNLITCR